MLDASVALAWFLSDENPSLEAYSLRVLELVRSEIAIAVVPLAWHEEVAGVVLRYARGRRLDKERFQEAMALYRTMPIETHLRAYTVGILVDRAQRYHAQALDAQYLDLALQLGLPIATIDRGLRAAAKVNRVRIFDPA